MARILFEGDSNKLVISVYDRQIIIPIEEIDAIECDDVGTLFVRYGEGRWVSAEIDNYQEIHRLLSAWLDEFRFNLW